MLETVNKFIKSRAKGGKIVILKIIHDCRDLWNFRIFYPPTNYHKISNKIQLCFIVKKQASKIVTISVWTSAMRGLPGYIKQQVITILLQITLNYNYSSLLQALQLCNAQV